MLTPEQSKKLADLFNYEILPFIKENEDDFNRLYETTSKNKKKGKDKYLEALRSIDIHIRSTSKPIPFIIEELKAVLPEWNEEED